MSGILGGLLGGVSAILLVWLLTLAQQIREHFPLIILTLPLTGAMIPSFRGTIQLIAGSFLTHLGGGSAGREGAIVQLSRKLAQLCIGKFHHPQSLILVSMGAGFGAALGAPLAGILFGFEFNRQSPLRPLIFFHSLVASFLAQFLVDLAGIHHFRFSAFEAPSFQLRVFALVLMVAILMGFATAFFHFMRHRVEQRLQNLNPRLAGFVGGMILSFVLLFFPLAEYQGLGFETISRSSHQVLNPETSLIKMVLTAITLGSGFQGGEFVPLAFIGSTLGSAFSFVDPNLTSLLAALGFVSLYAASTQTPLTGILLASELFGWNVLPFAALAVVMTSRIHRKISMTSTD